MPGDEEAKPAPKPDDGEEDPTLYEVASGPIRATLDESGSLESADEARVVSKVEGQSTILSMVPEGTRVKQGDVVVRAGPVGACGTSSSARSSPWPGPGRSWSRP